MSDRSQNVDVSDGVVPQRLVVLRLARGLTKAELADAAGVTYRTVHDLETGRRPRVQEKTLILLAQALDVAPAELLGFEAPTPDGSESEDAEARGSSAAEAHSSTARPVAARGRRRRWWVAVSALLLAIVVALGFRWSLDHARATHDGRALRAVLPGVPIVAWRQEFGAAIRFVDAAPWSDDEWLVALGGDSKDGGRLVAIDRPTGDVLWSLEPDGAGLRAAFADSSLAGGYFDASYGAAADVDGDGTAEYVAVMNHGLYYPSSIVVVDRDGKRLAQYEHAGHFTGLAVDDVDDDGSDEILATCTVNSAAHRGAGVVLFDPSRALGSSSRLEGMRGSAPYVFATRTEVSTDDAAYRTVIVNYPPEFMTALGVTRLVAQSPAIVHTPNAGVHFVVRVAPSADPDDSRQVILEFDRELQVTKVVCHDEFRVWIEQNWPRSLRDGVGPTSPRWLWDWSRGFLRYADGVLVEDQRGS